MCMRLGGDVGERGWLECCWGKCVKSEIVDVWSEWYVLTEGKRFGCEERIRYKHQTKYTSKTCSIKTTMFVCGID